MPLEYRPPAMSPPAAASHSSHPNIPPSVASSRRPVDSSRDAFPFSFKRPSRANPSSTSLVPSTAEGKPIPLDDSTAEHRTSALREINNHYPSRHQYSKSSGPQSSSTYSEPVIVRSYHPPVPGRRPMGTDGATCVAHGRTTSVSGLDVGGSGPFVARGLPFASKIGSSGNGKLGTMARARTNKASAVPLQQETRLPPVKAFSFKSFMANMEAQAGGGDINADLDRIAEICARSRYSLSNQYEVHYAPHGSGASFLAAAQQHQDAQGPTLQAVSSDDERSMKPPRRKCHTGRRNSRAMGTLETIMSSSRSSDDERSKQKSAAENGERVRGRATRKESDTSSPTTSPGSVFEDAKLQDQQTTCKAHARRSSTSLAIFDGTRQSPTLPDAVEPRPAASGLVGEPALPQASTSHLETRTAPEQSLEAQGNTKTTPAPPLDGRNLPAAKGSIPSIQETGPGAGLLNVLGAWLPWASAGKHGGRAEGSLRHLLKTADQNKGKGVTKSSS